MCIERGSVDLGHYSDRRGEKGGKGESPLAALGEPPAFVIPFDQISVKDECHALFQPAVRGLPCDSEGVDMSESARVKGHTHLCVCVCVYSV